MSANYKKLGDYIEVLNRRNTDLKLGLDSVRGISNTKQITETSKATVDESVISKFYVINPGEFVYNPRTTRMGDKVGLAFNNTDKPLLFTFNNLAFKIKDSAKDKLLPNYLYLFFCRSEFDRYARINSWGSATELFLFEDLCNIKFTAPDLKEQEKIVNTYNAITKRIQLKQKINENLEKTAQCLFEEMFPSIIDNGNNRFGDIIDFSNGRSRPEELGSIPVYGGNGIMSYTDKTNAENCIAIGRVGAYCGSTYLCKSKCWISDNAIKAKYKFSEKQFFAYYLLKKANLFERHIGTGQQLLTQGILGMIQLDTPKKELIDNFNLKCEPIEAQLTHNSNEIEKLQALKQLVISRISGM